MGQLSVGQISPVGSLGEDEMGKGQDVIGQGR